MTRGREGFVSRHRRGSAAAPGAQRGIAALMVVMVLFFIVSLVAAYANRNLIFEQRTSANQYRSTQALEAAEAGLEWTLAMLNHGRITATCTTSTSNADTSFRQRYIVTDSATGRLTPVDPALRPSCVAGAGSWTCSCPSSGAPSLTAPTSAGIHPAFRVRFLHMNPAAPAPPAQPGVIKVEVVACTRLDDGCLVFDGPSLGNEGRAIVGALVALTGNLASPPQVAVLARGSVGGVPFNIHNTSPAGNGITIQAGGTVDSSAMALHGIAGTPGELTIVSNDSSLNLTDLATTPARTGGDRLFAGAFNTWPNDTFKLQPAAVLLTCSAPSCSVTATAVRDAVRLNPGRPIWVQGNLSVDVSLGTAAAPVPVPGPGEGPVLLVVNGNLTFANPGLTIHGLVYVRTADWGTTGSDGTVVGAVVAENNIAGTGAITVVRDAELLQRLKTTTGSFVRVPGSWKDFTCPTAAPLC